MLIFKNIHICMITMQKISLQMKSFPFLYFSYHAGGEVTEFSAQRVYSYEYNILILSRTKVVHKKAKVLIMSKGLKVKNTKPLDIS